MMYAITLGESWPVVPTWSTASGTFLDKLILGLFVLVRGGAWGTISYDLSGLLWCPAGQVEQVVEGLLVGGHVGGHPSGFGSAAGRGVDHDGLFDSGQGVQQGFDGQVVAGPAGFESHQVDQLQGQDAGEGVYRDVVVCPVEHRLFSYTHLTL